MRPRPTDRTVSRGWDWVRGNFSEVDEWMFCGLGTFPEDISAVGRNMVVAAIKKSSSLRPLRRAVPRDATGMSNADLGTDELRQRPKQEMNSKGLKGSLRVESLIQRP